MLAHSGASSFMGVLYESWLPLLVDCEFATERGECPVAARFPLDPCQKPLGLQQVQVRGEVGRVDVECRGHLAMARPIPVLRVIGRHEAHQFDLSIGGGSEIPGLGIHTHILHSVPVFLTCARSQVHYTQTVGREFFSDPTSGVSGQKLARKKMCPIPENSRPELPQLFPPTSPEQNLCPEHGSANPL